MSYCQCDEKLRLFPACSTGSYATSPEVIRGTSVFISALVTRSPSFSFVPFKCIQNESCVVWRVLGANMCVLVLKQPLLGKVIRVH